MLSAPDPQRPPRQAILLCPMVPPALVKLAFSFFVWLYVILGFIEFAWFVEISLHSTF